MTATKYCCADWLRGEIRDREEGELLTCLHGGFSSESLVLPTTFNYTDSECEVCRRRLSCHQSSLRALKFKVRLSLLRLLVH